MSEHEDRIADELAHRITEVCRGYPDDFVIGELIASLGEAIGRAPHRKRPDIYAGVIAQLAQYISEIPP